MGDIPTTVVFDFLMGVDGLGVDGLGADGLGVDGLGVDGLGVWLPLSSVAKYFVTAVAAPMRASEIASEELVLFLLPLGIPPVIMGMLGGSSRLSCILFTIMRLQILY